MEAPSILIEGDGWSEEGAADFISQIDDLLHFSDADDAGRTDEASDGSWVSTATTGMCSELMSVAGADGTDSSGFCVPSEEDVAQLEWLSVFIEDSCRPSSEISPASILPSNPKPGRLLVSSPTSVLEPRIPTSPKFCVRPRTRRSRRPATTIPWTCPPIVFQKSSECSSVKPKRKWLESGRKCTHCAIEKTPQWRTGPLGPKTLCNACGVRYKSGRLLPEYRPAASPTFMPWKHSNSHRKVIEMRTKKASVGEGGAADAGEDDGGASR